jgi:hypothetical protein
MRITYYTVIVKHLPATWAPVVVVSSSVTSYKGVQGEIISATMHPMRQRALE